MDDTVTTGATMVVAGLAIAVVGGLGMARKLPASWMIGIRLPATTASDEAWVETHVVAGPWLVLAGFVPVATGIAFLAAGDVVPSWGVPAAYVAMVVLVVLGVVRGVRAAASTAGTTR